MRGRRRRFRSLGLPVSYVDVLARRGKSGYVRRRAVVGLGRMEETSREGKVVAADAERVLGDDASQLVLLDPLQGGVAVFDTAEANRASSPWKNQTCGGSTSVAALKRREALAAGSNGEASSADLAFVDQPEPGSVRLATGDLGRCAAVLVIEPGAGQRDVTVDHGWLLVAQAELWATGEDVSVFGTDSLMTDDDTVAARAGHDGLGLE